MAVDLNNSERLLLKRLVKQELRKAQTEPHPKVVFENGSQKLAKRKYGLKTLTTLYELENKLK